MFDSDDTSTDFAIALLTHYNFDLGGYTVSELIERWLNDYPANWVFQSVIEALYQGRYKAVSVEQILSFWHRRGQALYHYNYEFERLVCINLPQTPTGQPNTTNASPLVPIAVTSSIRDNELAVVKVKESAGEKALVQVIDTTAILPPTNQSSEMAQRNSAPTSDVPRSDNHRPIEQFTPPVDSSEFYTKLKAISQHNKDDP